MAGARVGAECNVGDHAFVESGAVVGNGVTIKNGVVLWDKVVVEDDVFLGPNVVFTNDLTPRAPALRKKLRLRPTRVGQGATIGANATVVCGTTIGKHAFVGAGAVVTVDVPPHALVVGNPARRMGWACTCGHQLGEELACTCGRRFQSDGSAGLRPWRRPRGLDQSGAAGLELLRLMEIPR
jgi:acetyltransferase-like isoleucine patch superfamily enzyme